ncbi:MAG: type II toxin-antitoxin system VapC family toxin, partial [Candidatus Aminicenantes bacterium]|nr:type II toxin-antitoxin system VapC family toxin [Candidatus Aminicenantes bacterium]
MILYLETSNLVKLYVKETDSEAVFESVRAADFVATSVLAYAEARAAFARKRREKGISGKSLERIKSALDRDWTSFFVLNVNLVFARQAGNLAEKHGLRGFDALHLASAVELRAAGAGDVVFSTADIRLAEAAGREG